MIILLDHRMVYLCLVHYPKSQRDQALGICYAARSLVAHANEGDYVHVLIDVQSWFGILPNLVRLFSTFEARQLTHYLLLWKRNSYGNLPCGGRPALGRGKTVRQESQSCCSALNFTNAKLPCVTHRSLCRTSRSTKSLTIYESSLASACMFALE